VPTQQYWNTLWTVHLRKAAPWARDNILWGIVMFLSPPIAALFIQGHVQIDWSIVITTLILYASSLLVYATIQICIAARKADAQKQEKINLQSTEIASLKEKLESLCLDSLPWQAIDLCREIDDFISGFGPAQEIKYVNGMSVEHFTQENVEGIERQSKIGAGFTRRFSPRITDIYNEFCEQGRQWEDKELENAMAGRMDDFVDSQIKTVVDHLKQLAAKMWAEIMLHSPKSTVCTQDSETQSI
jgi:hypothetical protein